MYEKNNNKTIFDIINEENKKLLTSFYEERPEKDISFSSGRSKGDMVILKNQGTFKLLQNTLQQFLKYGKDYFKNSRVDGNGRKLAGLEMTKQDKEFFGYDLNRIDFEKINSLKMEELKFILDNLINSSKTALLLMDDITVNFGTVKFTEKVKRIRNMKLVTNRILINAYLGYSSQHDSKDIYEKKSKQIENKLKLEKDNFQAWIIDKFREENIELPDISNIKPNKEMEIKITKKALKQL